MGCPISKKSEKWDVKLSNFKAKRCPISTTEKKKGGKRPAPIPQTGK